MGRKSTPLFLSLFTTLILPHWSRRRSLSLSDGGRKRGAAAAADCDSWPMDGEQNNAHYSVFESFEDNAAQE